MKYGLVNGSKNKEEVTNVLSRHIRFIIYHFYVVLALLLPVMHVVSIMIHIKYVGIALGRLEKWRIVMIFDTLSNKCSQVITIRSTSMNILLLSYILFYTCLV